MNKKDKEIKALKEYFEKEPSVVLAFVFGSYAKGREMNESDVDVAVYLKNEEKQNLIWSDITDILQKEVDLVVLNEAPATLVYNVLRSGIPLVIKDKKLYWDLYLKKSMEAEDFLRFLQEFRRIYKKTKSLPPDEKARLLERVQFLEEELEETEKFKKITFEEYGLDRDKRRIIERWTESILNATIDIAKMILASEKMRPPKTYEEALLSFSLFAGLSEKEAKRFSKFAELRNILAHEYLEILFEKIQNFIREGIPLYKRILDFLEEYLKK